jgi:hypothetical protein
MFNKKVEEKLNKSFEKIFLESSFSKNLESKITSKETISNYLRSAHYLVSHTPMHLRKALDESQKRNHADHVDYYLNKIDEEAGHDNWSKNDAQKLSIDLNQSVTPETAAIMRFAEELIDLDPRLYLAYIMFTEGITVQYGAKILSLIQMAVGIAPNELSVIQNHETADKEHANENLELVENLIPSDLRSAFIDTIDQITNKSLALFNSLTLEQEVSNARI